MSHGRADWTAVTEIQGKNPSGNLVVISLDADGNIVSVMKGEFGGSLKTLACDSNGYMIATMAEPENLFGDIHTLGSSELAARLDGWSSYERRGQIVRAEDFESTTEHYGLAGSGTGASAARSNETAHRGDYSAKLISGTTNPGYGAIYYTVYNLKDDTVGFEVYLACATTYQIDFMFTLYDHDNSYGGLIDVSWGVGATWRWMDSAANMHDIATLFQPLSSNIWLPIKATFDFATMKYKNVYIGNHSYDLSANALYNYGHPPAYENSYVQLEIRNNNRTAGNTTTIFLDDILITRGEP